MFYSYKAIFSTLWAAMSRLSLLKMHEWLSLKDLLAKNGKWKYMTKQIYDVNKWCCVAKTWKEYYLTELTKRVNIFTVTLEVIRLTCYKYLCCCRAFFIFLFETILRQEVRDFRGGATLTYGIYLKSTFPCGNKKADDKQPRHMASEKNRHSTPPSFCHCATGCGAGNYQFCCFPHWLAFTWMQQQICNNLKQNSVKHNFTVFTGFYWYRVRLAKDSSLPTFPFAPLWLVTCLW